MIWLHVLLITLSREVLGGRAKTVLNFGLTATVAPDPLVG
jgi:hypothetical protein